MVDYTSKTSSGSSLWLYILAGGIVLILLYALLASGGSTTIDPATLTAPQSTGVEVAPAASE